MDALLSDNAWFGRLLTALLAKDATSDRAAPPWSPVASAEESVERAELRLTLLEGVLALDEPSRSVVALRLLDGRDLATIARITGADEGTVRAWLDAGVSRLRTNCSG